MDGGNINANPFSGLIAAQIVSVVLFLQVKLHCKLLELLGESLLSLVQSCVIGFGCS